MSTTHVGKHSVTRESDDVVVLRIEGRQTLEEARALMVALQASNDERGGAAFLLSIVGENAEIPAETRKAWAEGSTTTPGQRAFVVGASFAIRTIAQLVTRAVATLTRAPPSVEFLKTEEEARARIAELRRKSTAASVPPAP